MEEDRIRLEALRLVIKSYGTEVHRVPNEQLELEANEFFNYITTGRMQ